MRPISKVVVVCAWYNRYEYVRESVDSILAQDFDSFEVVIVNDGSTDPRVREVLDSYDDPRLRVIHQDNTGFVVAIKRAINASEAPFIAIQGAGDVSYSQRLAQQYDFLEKNTEYAITGCRYYNVVKSKGKPNKKHLAKLKTQNPNGSDICRGNPFSHGEVMIRRESYNEVGGYRIFFANSQDKDLWLRLSQSYKLHILPDVMYERGVFKHDGISASLKKTLLQIAYSRICDVCYKQRLAGKIDNVDDLGNVAMSKIPKGPRTSLRVALAVRQAKKFNTLNRRDLKYVSKIYGVHNYVLAILVKIFIR